MRINRKVNPANCMFLCWELIILKDSNDVKYLYENIMAYDFNATNRQITRLIPNYDLNFVLHSNNGDK